MMHLVEEWETRERLRKRIVALLDKVAYESFEAMTDDEQTAVIHMAVANRRSRRRD